jgi:hypothetical protein
MAESFNFSVGAFGEGRRPSRLKNPLREVSLDDAIRRINNLPVSQEQKKQLEKLARKVPNGSLGNLLLNYKSHLKSL